MSRVLAAVLSAAAILCPRALRAAPVPGVQVEQPAAGEVCRGSFRGVRVRLTNLDGFVAVRLECFGTVHFLPVASQVDGKAVTVTHDTLPATPGKHVLAVSLLDMDGAALGDTIRVPFSLEAVGDDEMEDTPGGYRTARVMLGHAASAVGDREQALRAVMEANRAGRFPDGDARVAKARATLALARSQAYHERLKAYAGLCRRLADGLRFDDAMRAFAEAERVYRSAAEPQVGTDGAAALRFGGESVVPPPAHLAAGARLEMWRGNPDAAIALRKREIAFMLEQIRVRGFTGADERRCRKFAADSCREIARLGYLSSRDLEFFKTWVGNSFLMLSDTPPSPAELGLPDAAL